jgi:hypothetical protein
MKRIEPQHPTSCQHMLPAAEPTIPGKNFRTGQWAMEALYYTRVDSTSVGRRQVGNGSFHHLPVTSPAMVQIIMKKTSPTIEGDSCI